MANNQGNQLINYLGLTTIIQFQCRTVRTSIQDNYIYCYRLILNCKRRCCSGYQLSGGNCERKSLNWSKYALHFNLNNVYIYSRSTVLLSDNRRRGCVAFQTGIFYTSLAHTNTHTRPIHLSIQPFFAFICSSWMVRPPLFITPCTLNNRMFVRTCMPHDAKYMQCNTLQYNSIALHTVYIYILYYTALYIYTLVMYNLYNVIAPDLCVNMCVYYIRTVYVIYYVYIPYILMASFCIIT